MMSYRIQYQPKNSALRRRRSVRLPLLTVLCFLIFLMMVNLFWPEGASFMKSRAQAGNAVMMLDQLAENLLHGEALSAAFSAFCKGIQP